MKSSRQTVPKSLAGAVSVAYADSGRPDARPFSAFLPMNRTAFLSVYGGLVPLGFAHSVQALTVYTIVYHIFSLFAMSEQKVARKI